MTCNGCRVQIDNLEYMHVGAPFTDDTTGVLVAKQQVGAIVPALALLGCMVRGQVTLVVPENVLASVFIEPARKMSAAYGREPLTFETLNGMYNLLVAEVQALVARGDIVRDFFGAWHTYLDHSEVEKRKEDLVH